jgi:serine/threonine protein kinase
MNRSVETCPKCGAELADGLCPQCLLLAGIEPTPTSPRARWVPPSPEDLRAQLTGYQVLELLGLGGMGAVYKGWQNSLDRPVAIKVLPPGLTEEDEQFAARFKHEAKTMARLSHPAIVSVHDYGETLDGLCYIVMEFVEGTDVQKMMADQGRLPPERALAVAMNVCDALVYAHEHGIIHRDIKPANVMVDAQGRVRVADFGLAKVADAGATLLTDTNVAVGSPGYIAPETLTMGLSVDARADLYATGVMLYAMLTGRVPQGRFEAASVRVPGLDPRFDAIVNRAMQEEREARYSSAAELRADLSTILTIPKAAAGGAPLKKSQRAAAPPAARRVRPAVILIGLAAAALCAVGLQRWKPWVKQDGDELVNAGSAPSANPGSRGVEHSQPQGSNSSEVSNSQGPKSPTDLPPELAVLDTEFQKLKMERVIAPFEAEVAKLNASYTAGLEREIMKDRAEGRPDEALLLEEERTLIRDRQIVPSLEEESAPGNPTSDRLKRFRVTYRKMLAKLEAQRVEKLKSVIGPLDFPLRTLETDLTKQGRVTDAKVVREYRESLRSALGSIKAEAP